MNESTTKRSKTIVAAGESDNVVLPIIKANELHIFPPPIGTGAFGKVYKGKCRGKDVAVKVLDGIEWDETVLDEFMSEVDIMARLLHPNILLCMGACTEEDFGQNNYAIVMEFMPRGDLHHLLHSDIELSLPRKIQFGIEICQGMAWLSGQNILHRDLKPANVLLDQNWTCKVCDFGLSQITRGKNKMRDEDEAPGSVLWMAPEVLLNETIDSKLDVYSFSLVLWEIVTRADLFSEYDDKDIFTEDIARKGVRPSLDGVHPALQSIIVRAWDRDPQKRPTFQELIVLLEQALLEIYLPVSLCPDAAKFWSKFFGGKSKAPLKDFTPNLLRFLGKRRVSPTQEKCIKALLSENEGSELVVSIEKFSNLLKWFGKLKLDANYNVVDRLESVMKNDWFFGGISSKEAEDKLNLSTKSGTFLIRLNMGGGTAIEKAPYTLSRINKKGNVVHTRIYQKGDGLLMQIEKGGKDVKFRNKKSNLIEDFVNLVKYEDETLCKESSPGYPYKEIFASEPSKRIDYEEAPGEDDDSNSD
eukprot:TRINITY_DN11964_c0_g1_i1.p1 TRINITY_DN11964_c0_g1~~TRINITY_DN11964_c0_g1_i1.p1  ORF type:complete len:529 (-),score=121.69 TRINITY_DN11964_c0_g1_i1:95-1681(-)